MSYKIKVALLMFGAIVLKVAVAQIESCQTPDRIAGDCINLKKCPPLLARMRSPNRKESDVQFVHERTCGFEGQKGKEPKVCCPITDIQGNKYEQQSVNLGIQGWDNGQHGSRIAQNSSIPDLLPQDCGTSLTNRILGGTETELDEYTWLSLLQYRKSDGRIVISCAGAIINKRYIMTAAHCIIGNELPKTWRLESVRLGDYNTATEEDCKFEANSDNKNCIEDPPLIVRVEAQIVHENFDPLSKDQRYDIALLRLAVDLKFTAYMKPICLPSHSTTNEIFTVAGWGSTEFRKASNIKLKVIVPFVDIHQCSAAYQYSGIHLGQGQMCAGGEKGKDSCRGDSGGPLMQQKNSTDGILRWEAVGIVSFGPSPCGLTGIPGVYTRVYDFLPWIVSKLRL